MSYHSAELGLNKSEDTEPHNEIHQTPATPSIVSDTQATRLQHLQTELEQFLTQHIEKVNSLKHEVIDILQPQNPIQDIDMQRSPSLNCSRPTSMNEERIHENNASPASVSDPDVPAHAEALQNFLESHVENLRNLQRALSHDRDDVPVEPVSVEEAAPSEKSTTADADKRNEIMITHCAALSKQFTMNILISTFSSTFLVGALSLTNDMIGSESAKYPTWPLCKVLGIVAIILNLGTINLSALGVLAATGSQNTARNINIPVQFHISKLPYLLSTCLILQSLGLNTGILSFVGMGGFIIGSNSPAVQIVITALVLIDTGAFYFVFIKALVRPAK